MPGRIEGDRKLVADLLSGIHADPQEILAMMRDYPQVVALKVRIYNDERKKEYAEQHADG